MLPLFGNETLCCIFGMCFAFAGVGCVQLLLRIEQWCLDSVNNHILIVKYSNPSALSVVEHSRACLHAMSMVQLINPQFTLILHLVRISSP